MLLKHFLNMSNRVIEQFFVNIAFLRRIEQPREVTMVTNSFPSSSRFG